MIGIVIVAHGGLAREYLAAVEHVVGPQMGVRAIAIEDDHDRSGKQAEICAAANAVDAGQGVVVVTDMFGGSPFEPVAAGLRGGEPADHVWREPADADQTGKIA